MMRLKTRHSRDFSLCGECAELDPSQCPYVLAYPDVYEAKRKVLSDYLQTSQFLWCIDARRDFLAYESQKPMEWIIEVEESRIVGCVNEDRWLQFLENGHVPLVSFASRSGNIWRGAPIALLAAYPLRPEEIIEWRLLDENNSVIQEGTSGDLPNLHLE
ncbi:MAG: hypothetical protein ABFD90_10140 [Phycisphaerales bacterium]